MRRVESALLRWTLLAVAAGFITVASGQEAPEAEQAFTAAFNSFQGAWHERAENEFAEFVKRFPGSPRVAEAILLQARCRFELKQFQPAIDLLAQHVNAAGPLEDQYRFLMAEAEAQLNRLPEAITGYAALLTVFTNSPVRLEASYGEALAYYKLGNYAKVIELLQEPAGAFQQAARNSTNDSLVLRGHQVLAQAYSAQKQYDQAAEALNALASRSMPPELDWQRQFSLATIEVANKKSDVALSRVTNLVALAHSAGKPVLHANALTLKAEVLRDEKPDEAIEAYEQIIQIKGISSSQRRQALLKIVDLLMDRNRLPDSIARIERFLKENPKEVTSELVLMLGELHLKHYYALVSGAPAPPPAATNALAQARAQFDQIIRSMTNGPLLGKAYLNQGWCLWEEGQQNPARMSESMEAYQKAVLTLPPSEEQALARLKWGDCQFFLKDYTNALANYRLILDTYKEMPDVKAKLFDQTLAQIVRVHLDGKDFKGARSALEQLLQEFPQSPKAERALLVFGQALLADNKPKEAREALLDFQKRFSESPLLPEARQVLAKTYVQEFDWPSALQEYERWITNYTDHALRPQVEFDHAWACYQSGDDVKALSLFTNFVAKFPEHELAPLAQFWVGDYFYRHGDYFQAELHYQNKVLLKNPAAARSGLSYQARLMLGKAALRRDSPTQAWQYLTSLVNDPTCPAWLIPEAWFVLGDVLLEEKSGTNKFDNAIIAFDNILRTTNRLEPLARGKIANCHLQLAINEPQRYALATNEYMKILESPLADITTRSQAQVGIGLVLEKMAEQKEGAEREQLLEQALNRYLDVVLGKLVRPGESSDPFWVKEAGLNAGRLAERLKKFPQAIQLYERLLRELPTLAPTWQRRLDALRERQNQ